MDDVECTLQVRERAEQLHGGQQARALPHLNLPAQPHHRSALELHLRLPQVEMVTVDVERDGQLDRDEVEYQGVLDAHDHFPEREHGLPAFQSLDDLADPFDLPLQDRPAHV